MRRHLGLAVLFAISTATGFAQKPLVVGICPFIDDTTTPAGERSGRMLPVMFLDKAKSASFLPIIVNPGPGVSPADTDWAAEVGRMAGADAVLVGRVRTLATGKGKKASEQTLQGHVLLDSHAADLVLAATLVGTADGRELAKLETSELVKGSFMVEAAKYTGIGAAFHHGEPFWFANTHLGQAIGRSAEKLVSGVGQNLGGLQPGGAYAVTAAGPSCQVGIQVLYKAKNKASKMYLVAVNGKEESLGVNDGRLQVQEPSGPILLHISVKDAPYRQPLQDEYYANSMLDCSRENNTLLFEIGSAGEGVIRWQ